MSKLDELRCKAKVNFDNMKKKVKMKGAEVLSWAQRNPQATIGILSVAGSVGGFLVKNLTKNRLLNKEQRLKDNYVYDRSLGHYWELDHKLSSKEWVEIDKRRSDGERMGDILVDMKVLK